MTGSRATVRLVQEEDSQDRPCCGSVSAASDFDAITFWAQRGHNKAARIRTWYTQWGLHRGSESLARLHEHVAELIKNLPLQIQAEWMLTWVVQATSVTLAGSRMLSGSSRSIPRRRRGRERGPFFQREPERLCLAGPRSRRRTQTGRWMMRR